ncbi:mucin-19-like [Chamaea fasciata]|uniref:mucin-19-like n=1 Tax=Chamaea fasciata TaxID=190680 RepID=UPI00336A2505
MEPRLLLALGALLGALCPLPPPGGRPRPSPRLPLGRPSPHPARPPTPPPLPPDCDSATSGSAPEDFRVTGGSRGDEGRGADVTAGSVTATSTAAPTGSVTTQDGSVTAPAGSVTPSPGSDEVLVATDGGVALEGTLGAPNCSGDTSGHGPDVPGDATTAAGSVTASPGSDNLVVAAGNVTAEEGTEEPDVTGDPGDTVGHLDDVTGNATTTMTFVTASPGSDNLVVATGNDTATEGTEGPGVTGDPGDTWGHLSDVTGDATTVVAPVTTPPGSDKLLEATNGDVAMEGTEEPDVTADPGDTVGHLDDVTGDATTTVTFVTVSPAGDNLVVASDDDTTLEGTTQPDVTGGPGDTVGRDSKVTEGATTPVGLVTKSPAGDRGGDVALEGTLGATNCSGDASGHGPDVPGDVTTPPGSDNLVVAAGNVTAEEGTEEPDVTGDPRDSWGHLDDVTGNATATVTFVTPSPGDGKVLVASDDDTTLEGTTQPDVTADPGDTWGHLSDITGDATTVVAPVTTPPGSDKLLVATNGGVAMEGTEEPDVTADPGDIVGHLSDVTGDATTTVTFVTASPAGDNLVVASDDDTAVEGTEEPDVTGDPRDIWGHLSDVTGNATTTVTSDPASPAGDKVLVASDDDTTVEGTEGPGVTGGPGDILGLVTNVPREATTPVAPVTSPPAGDIDGGVALEGTLGATNCSGDTSGHGPDVPGDATTAAGSVTASPGSDNLVVAAGNVTAEEGTEEPDVTGDPRDSWGHLDDVTGNATATVTSDPASPAGGKVLVASDNDTTLEGTEEPDVTGDPRDTWGHFNDVTGDVTTVVAPVTTPPGSDNLVVATGNDTAEEGTTQPDVTGGPGDAVGHLSDVTGVATPPGGDPGRDLALEGTLAATNCSGGASRPRPRDVTTPAAVTSPVGGAAATPPEGDAIMVAPGGDVIGDDVTGCRHPPAPPPPPAAFPVTAAPPPHGAPGGSSPSPYSSPLPLLSFLLLPLLLL